MLFACIHLLGPACGHSSVCDPMCLSNTFPQNLLQIPPSYSELMTDAQQCLDGLVECVSV